MENSQLLQYIGQTKTKNLQEEITKEYFEIFHKRFPNFGENHKMNSLVTVTKDSEIKKIGMSCMNDLIMDNWGLILQQIIAGNDGLGNDAFVTPPATDNEGTTNNAIKVYGTSLCFNMTDTVPAGLFGSTIRIGKGTTPVTRQDFKIETAFTAGAPENDPVGTGDGGWNSGLGQISIPMQLVAGAFGAISETCLFLDIGTISPVELQQYLISHDNISPVVNFITGESVNVDYSMVFN